MKTTVGTLQVLHAPFNNMVELNFIHVHKNADDPDTFFPAVSVSHLNFFRSLYKMHLRSGKEFVCGEQKFSGVALVQIAKESVSRSEND